MADQATYSNPDSAHPDRSQGIYNASSSTQWESDAQNSQESSDDLEQRKKQIMEYFLDRLREKSTGLKQVWPHLLIRSYVGDRGVRPISDPHFRFDSPDILLVRGIHQTYHGQPIEFNLHLNTPYTLFVHVWNLGHCPATGIKLSTYWRENSPAMPEQHLIGSTMVDLTARNYPQCHGLVRIPITWSVNRSGGVYIIAKLDCLLDPAGEEMNPKADRHIAAREIIRMVPR